MRLNSAHIKIHRNPTMATSLFRPSKIQDGRQIQDGRHCTNRRIFVNTWHINTYKVSIPTNVGTTNSLVAFSRSLEVKVIHEGQGHCKIIPLIFGKFRLYALWWAKILENLCFIPMECVREFEHGILVWGLGSSLRLTGQRSLNRGQCGQRDKMS